MSHDASVLRLIIVLVVAIAVIAFGIWWIYEASKIILVVFTAVFITVSISIALVSLTCAVAFIMQRIAATRIALARARQVEYETSNGEVMIRLAAADEIPVVLPALLENPQMTSSLDIREDNH